MSRRNLRQLPPEPPLVRLVRTLGDGRGSAVAAGRRYFDDEIAVFERERTLLFTGTRCRGHDDVVASPRGLGDLLGRCAAGASWNRIPVHRAIELVRELHRRRRLAAD